MSGTDIDRQSATGQVDTGTPSVQYDYADSASDQTDGENGLTADYVRPTDMIYPTSPANPNPRDVSYGYVDPSLDPLGVDSVMSELATISDSARTSSGQIAELTYLGVGQAANLSYTEPQIGLSYAGANNSFSALDRFGDVLSQVWSSYGSASGNLSTPLDGYGYSYNNVQDRTAQANLKDAALSQLFGNDALDRLMSATRANGQAETWSLDSLGNFVNYTNTATGTNQNRSADPSNEITAIAGDATPAYDLAGNMTTTPAPSDPSSGLTCVYDAWDRLADVYSGSTIVAAYQYDGTGREVAELSNFVTVASTQYPTAVTYSIYSGQNAIETRTTTFTAGDQPTVRSVPPKYQYVFSPLGGKTPLVRDTYASGSIVPADRLYHLTDANTNVTAVVGISGTTWQVAERYSFDPYGGVTVYNAGWTTQIGTSLASSTVSNTIGFASMIFDPLTGLYQDEARWYSTVTSTFISQDPAQADLNTYRYCGNAPTDFIDPFGLWKIKRAGQAWAEAVSECGDTIYELADLIHLNVREGDAWLKMPKRVKFNVNGGISLTPSQVATTEDADIAPLSANQNFKIPNSIAIFKQDTGGWTHAVLWHFDSRVDEEATGFKADGFRIDYPAISEQAFKAAWRQSGIYGFIFVGHGNDSAIGQVNVDTVGDAADGPTDVTPPYHLALVEMYACNTAFQYRSKGQETGAVVNGKVVLTQAPLVGWDTHVSQGGHFVGYAGDVDWFSVSRLERNQSSPPPAPTAIGVNGPGAGAAGSIWNARVSP